MAIRVNPSIYDVAAKAGVSTGTVSNFLNNKMKVGSPTYEKIRQAIIELDYVPHGNTGSKRSRQIGRIVFRLHPTKMQKITEFHSATSQVRAKSVGIAA